MKRIKSIVSENKVILLVVFILLAINLLYLYYKNNQFYNYSSKKSQKCEILYTELEAKTKILESRGSLEIIEDKYKDYVNPIIFTAIKYSLNPETKNILLPY